jgi:hypothetical protein
VREGEFRDGVPDKEGMRDPNAVRSPLWLILVALGRG